MTPPAPRDLEPRGRTLWRWTVRAFELEPTELAILLELCRTLDLCERLAAELRAGSLVVAGSKGQLVANPLIGQLARQRDLASRLVARLGLPTDEASTGTAQFKFAQAGALARWGYRPKVVAGGSR